jgi:molybdenum cofactor biosynthesis protein MoaC
MKRLSHVDADGRAQMVDVGDKVVTRRSAIASVTVELNEESFIALKENRSTKGDVFTAAKLAGIQAAKRTSELIPLCHQLPLDQVDLVFELNQEVHTLGIQATVICSARTGVEMEALTACSVAALTVYDMLKAIQKDIVITDLCLLEKKGGRSGEYTRKNS